MITAWVDVPYSFLDPSLGRLAKFYFYRLLMRHELRHIRTTLEDMHQLMEKMVDLRHSDNKCCPADRSVVSLRTSDGDGREARATMLDEEELMTIKEAVAQLNVSRYTIDAMRKRGDLTSIRRNGRVRLKRHEVLAARKWYSVQKGKV